MSMYGVAFHFASIHTGCSPVEYNELNSYELCLFFFQRGMELEANENPHEFINVVEAEFNPARRVKFYQVEVHNMCCHPRQ